MKNILVLLSFVMLVPQAVLSQSSSDLTFKGHVTVVHKNCADVEISVCQSSSASPDCMEVDRFTTKKNGQFTVGLEKNSAYEIRVKKDGFVERVIQVNTSVGDAELDASKSVFEFDVELSLYPEAKAPVTVASVYFDGSKEAFDYRLPAK